MENCVQEGLDLEIGLSDNKSKINKKAIALTGLVGVVAIVGIVAVTKLVTRK